MKVCTSFKLIFLGLPSGFYPVANGDEGDEFHFMLKSCCCGHLDHAKNDMSGMNHFYRAQPICLPSGGISAAECIPKKDHM